MSFKRTITDDFIGVLQNNDLYINFIRPDVLKSEIFAGIRNEKIDFYFKGGRLFSFDKTLDIKTHIKFASVIPKLSSDYLSEKDLKKYALSVNFKDNYNRIKENCKVYSDKEASGVSSLYHKFSYADNKHDIVVLDIEISLESIKTNETESKRSKQDRVDILLFDKKNKILRFYEAKHYTNPELWSIATMPPQLSAQLSKYENQVKVKNSEILNQYKNYINVVNDLFNLSLPYPEILEIKVPLLIFGFDRDQLKNRLTNLLKHKYMKEFHYYAIGNIKGAKINNIWNKSKKF